MKKSLIWITAGIATVGFGVPAFAARGDSPEHIAPAKATVPATVATVSTIDDKGVDTTVNSVDDNGVDNPATHDVNDDNGVDATVNSIDDNGVDASVATVTTVDDKGVDASVATVTTVDDSGKHGGGDN